MSPTRDAVAHFSASRREVAPASGTAFARAGRVAKLRIDELTARRYSWKRTGDEPAREQSKAATGPAARQGLGDSSVTVSARADRVLTEEAR